MHPPIENLPIAEEYQVASDLMRSIERLRRSWVRIPPPPPVRRGDVMLLGFLLEQERQSQPPPTLGELAKMLHHSPPGVTQKVNVLEAEGLLTRTVSESDRRIACVALTQRGRELAEEVLRGFWTRIEAGLKQLGEENARTLIDLLNQLGGVIEAGGPPPEQSTGNTEPCRGDDTTC